MLFSIKKVGYEILKLSVKLLSMKLDINGHEGNDNFILYLVLCILNWDLELVICSIDMFTCLNLLWQCSKEKGAFKE